MHKPISEVKAKKPNTIIFNNFKGSEEFTVGASNVYINYTKVQLHGSGTVEIGIGTGNFTSGSADNVVGYISYTGTFNQVHGKLVNFPFPSQLFYADQHYFISVITTSGDLTWGYTGSPVNPIGDLQDFYDNATGQLSHDNLTPFVYIIGYHGASSVNNPNLPISAAIDSVSNMMYVACYGTAQTLAVNLSIAGSPIVHSFPVGNEPDSVAYDSYDGSVYVANFGSSDVSVIDLTTLSVSSFSVGVGAYPKSIIMDQGNGYIYVANYGSNNVTLENTFTSATINSIATGMDPSWLVYNTHNGYIYVADTGTNQITEINGGSIYFHSTPGTLIHSSLSGSGQIISSGYTHFVTPVAFHMQDGLVLTNYSNMKYVTSSANVPVSVVNDSGKIFLSSFLLNIAGSNSSVSGIGANTILLNVSSVSITHLYSGEHFIYTDLYNNPYPAMVTAVFISGFNYSINSEYAAEINQILYKEYNHSSSGNMNSWNFSGFPFHVTLSGTNLLISAEKQIYVYSVNFEYLGVKVLNI